MQTLSALSNPFTAATLLLLLLSALVSLTTFSVNTGSSFFSLHHLDAHFTVDCLLVLPVCNFTVLLGFFSSKEFLCLCVFREYLNNMRNVITKIIVILTEGRRVLDS